MKNCFRTLLTTVLGLQTIYKMIPSKQQLDEYRKLPEADFQVLVEAIVSLECVLKKYIAHVAWNEGVDFLRDIDQDERFTDEEWKYLQSLS